MDAGSPLFWFAIVWILCGIIGARIGRQRGRELAGALLGVALGPFGWFLVGLGPDRRPVCPECGGVIVEGARRCKNCGQPLPEASAVWTGR